MTDPAADQDDPPAEPAPHRARRWADAHRDDLAAVAIWAVARLVLVVGLGLRMDDRFLWFGPQMPDLTLLQDRLAETLWYLHTQPPLYAGFVGLALKVSPLSTAGTFLVTNLAMGVALAVVLGRLFRLLGLGRPATFVALALVVTNPALVALELIASYDQPTILLLAALALKTGRYVASGLGRDLAWVASLATAAALTRTIFHPLWLALVLAGVLALRHPRAEPRRVAALVGAPLLLVLALVAKNAVLFDVTGLTSFAGPSISKIAGAAASDEQVAELQRDGTVSPIFGRPVFWGYDTYADGVEPCRRTRPDVPVLTETVRRYGGYPNMDDECMLEVYRVQGADGIAYAKAHPGRFAAAQLEGAQMLFEPALPIVFTENADELRGLQTAYRWTPLYAQVQLDPVATTEFGALRVLDHGGIELVPAMLLATLAAVAIGAARIRLLVPRRRRTGGGDRRAGHGAWAAVGLTCAWVTVVGSVLEINENARYRLLIEPFLLATVVFGAQEAIRWGRRRWVGSGGRVDGASERPRPR
ncbi:MAG: hypothetical protein KDB04_04930 [Acidimicrobiales bacterium]|nr:hypothetical protein [Acidimicrobiales bacterium]